MSNSFRVAVIDDHPMFRDGVVNMLMRAGDIEVVGEGATAADALRIAQEHSPDVMLLDLQMAGGGIEAASNLAHAHPDMRIVMLTASERDCKKSGRIDAVADYNPHDLTSREEETLALLAQGKSNKEIARAFSCTERTVKHHMTNIMQKLKVRHRVQAALKFQPGRNKSAD
jgi:two-component system nitrate/nitrite response regulator NarL